MKMFLEFTDITGHSVGFMLEKVEYIRAQKVDWDEGHTVFVMTCGEEILVDMPFAEVREQILGM